MLSKLIKALVFVGLIGAGYWLLDRKIPQLIPTKLHKNNMQMSYDSVEFNLMHLGYQFNNVVVANEDTAIIKLPQITISNFWTSFLSKDKITFTIYTPEFNYHPAWPALTELKAKVIINDKVIVQLKHGDIVNSPINELEAIYQENSLIINANMALDASRGVDVLPQLKLLQLKGPSNLKLTLNFTPQKLIYNGLVELKDVTSVLPEVGLVQKINGQVNFDNIGVRAQELQANLRDNKVNFNFKKLYSESLVTGSGLIEFSQEFLRHMLPQLAKAINGVPTFNFTLRYDYQKKETQVELGSSLEKVAIDLPEPMYKELNQVGNLKIIYEHKAYAQYKVNYNDVILTKEKDRLELQAANASVDLDKWAAYLEQNKIESKIDIPWQVSLKKLKWKNLELNAVKINHHNDTISLQSSAIKGDIYLPTVKNKGLAFNLEYAELPLLTNDNLTQDLKIFPLQFACRKFSYNNKFYGKVTANINEHNKKIQLNELTIEHPDFSLSAKGEENGSSFLQGKVEVARIEPLLNMLAIKADIKEGSGIIEFNCSYPGRLWQLNTQLNGRINVRLKNGRLLNINPGLGRILDLLSLDSIRKRLQLDFTDLTGRGFVFNTLESNISLSGAHYYLAPLTIDGASAKIVLEGYIKPVSKEIDLKMAIMPKVAAGLPVAAALAVNPAVGAGIWLVDKLSGLSNNTQAKRPPNFRYRVVGTLEQPIIQDN